MNKDQFPILAENKSDLTETEPVNQTPKKKYARPTLSEPEGLLETTRFFFQTLGASSAARDDGGRGHQNTN